MEGRRACADALCPAKPNPNAPTNSFEPAIKLRRDVFSVAFSAANFQKIFLFACTGESLRAYSISALLHYGYNIHKILG